MREPTITCGVLDCRITGRPTFGRKAFFCTKHVGLACDDRSLNEYTGLAGERRRLEARCTAKPHLGAASSSRGLGRATFLETNSWSRLVDQIKAKFELKPGVELG
ncbi:hypothetical protein [Caulobacter sp. Root343]|uniref:hypothetical protein n=1 Tax=Caulobacter sp. Root343 TaxID=1736520 RepID=UPI0006FD0A0C|nr:hypothetical protein [Caulobacter sp. Root343]KQV66626.1 hypothetical protein ASC70_12395 [Caulobacter sp. Root343]